MILNSKIKYRIPSLEESKKLYLSNTKYFSGFTPADLSYKMQKKGATIEELKAFGVTQMLEMTESDKQMIKNQIEKMENRLNMNGLKLPELSEITFIKSTQLEEGGSEAYTHGTQIYLGESVFERLNSQDPNRLLKAEEIFWHELFHCLTRNNKKFRKDMYKIIHFTTEDSDFQIPESIHQKMISNPDVEHHDSYATFIINGKPVDCFLVFIVRKDFEKKGDNFFMNSDVALVPLITNIDKNDNKKSLVPDLSGKYYSFLDISNYLDIFGGNTFYAIDPEETMADNFAYAMLYGVNGKKYKNKEMIQKIIDYLKTS